ncbi:sterol desaturase family protein [uncultured Roseovarius sp.]|mgnify:FL=1|uniref:sterol desaturase family protein n=1 Tax=uncultured Roseovarius sp. TaxID=293344 RepID=UPI0025DBA328|nr:sterol desaturase family protein [uncultured Roseovarius sp.]
MQDKTPSESKTLPGWNHVPEVPIAVSPFFSWPPNPARMVQWIAARWLRLAENSILVVVALITWAWFQPSLETTKTLSLDWVAFIWLRNIVLMSVVAGGLHWFFYMRRGQGDRLKFDPRELMVKGRQFTFGGQVRDNMFWTLFSGVGFWTAYEVLMFWLMGNGWIPVLAWADSPVWFVLIFLLTPVWISFHFYWVHRALHWGPLYKLAHALHHRNVNVGPWSGLSMHPVEHLIFFSSILVHCIVPAHPLHILFHMQHQSLTAATSHTGYEDLLVKDRKQLALGTFHHQMHHRYFEVNYGNLEMPWDKWFGTFHDGTVDAHEALKDRRGRRG